MDGRGRGCALALPERCFGRSRPAAALLALALVGGVAASDALQYHASNLAPTARYEELASLDSRFAGRGPALFTDYDEYALYSLRDLDVGGPDFMFPPRAIALAGHGHPVNLDRVPPAALLSYPLIVTRRDPAVAARRPPTACSGTAPTTRCGVALPALRRRSLVSDPRAGFRAGFPAGFTAGLRAGFPSSARPSGASPTPPPPAARGWLPPKHRSSCRSTSRAPHTPLGPTRASGS